MDTSELRFGSVQNLFLELETLPLTEPFRMHTYLHKCLRMHLNMCLAMYLGMCLGVEYVSGHASEYVFGYPCDYVSGHIS